MPMLPVPRYSYEELPIATENFHSGNKIGHFGSVYKGILLNGQEIAVKMVSNTFTSWNMELMNEVAIMSKLQHRTIVRLLGQCDEREGKMLIHEYVPNKSLDAYLLRESKERDMLDWNRRAIIINKGIGRGLLYLHRDSGMGVIHRDLKAGSILLDKDLNPKISKFGLARIIQGSQDEAETFRIVGTFGYMAPEHALRGIYSVKTDVYSYGVLLLEIISGKRYYSYGRYYEGCSSVIEYAWKLWNENEPLKLVDPALFGPPIETEILRYIHVGLLCVQQSPVDRPNVSTFLSMLDREIAELPRPKLPAFCARPDLLESQCYQQHGHC